MPRRRRRRSRRKRRQLSTTLQNLATRNSPSLLLAPLLLRILCYFVPSFPAVARTNQSAPMFRVIRDLLPDTLALALAGCSLYTTQQTQRQQQWQPAQTSFFHANATRAGATRYDSWHRDIDACFARHCTGSKIYKQGCGRERTAWRVFRGGGTITRGRQTLDCLYSSESSSRIAESITMKAGSAPSATMKRNSNEGSWGSGSKVD